MIAKFILVMAIKITATTAPVFAVISVEDTMEACVAEMHRASYTWPDEKRKALACWKVKQEIPND